MTDILAFNGVARAYTRGTPVLDGVTFSMREGDIVGLLGRNGAGKTTLLHLGMGMLFPHAGTVRAFGIDPFVDPVSVKRRIGYVAEDQVLPPRSGISEIIAFHRHLFPDWDDTLERELLDRFGLAGNTQRIGQLSKGQARQVALVCAVCHRPELLILDEPAGGLDPAARRQFLETSIQLLNREGTAILFSSHHMNDVERLGGRVVLLESGKVRIDGTVDELREEHCIAMIPQRAAQLSVIEALPHCLRVRGVINEWHAVFQTTPTDAQRILNDSGITSARCVSVPLEELFVELLGGERFAEAS